MRIGIIVIAGFLAGCATAKTTYLPDGRPGMAIDCSGSALSWDYCYRKAGEICGSLGYDVVAQNGESSGSIVTAYPSTVTAVPVVSRSLLIGCKKPAPKDQ